jgi:hypothetical protein
VSGLHTPPPAADLDGRARAVTMLTSLRRGGPTRLRLRFALTRLIPSLVKIGLLRSVYFTRWTILTSIPYNGPPQQPPDGSTAPYLLWDSTFSVPMELYVESFVHAIGRQIRLLWRSSRGFPGTESATELQRYIDAHSHPGAYFYCAYPEASVRTILAALDMAREHRFLEATARAATPQQFETVYQGFLVRQQGNL